MFHMLHLLNVLNLYLLFFCSRTHLWCHIIFSYHEASGFSNIPQTPCFQDLDSIKFWLRTQQNLHWDLLEVCCVFRLGWWVWGQKTTEVKCCPIISMVHTIDMIYHSWGWPWSPGRGLTCQAAPTSSVQFLLPIPLSIGYFWEGSHYARPILKKWAAMFLLLQSKVSREIILNFSQHHFWLVFCPWSPFQAFSQ